MVRVNPMDKGPFCAVCNTEMLADPYTGDYICTKKDCAKNQPIYDNARAFWLDVQQKQISKGIQKYPEPLNPDSWTIDELADHAVQENVDQMHYITALREKGRKLERQIEELNVIKLWECPDCGFAFDAIHTDCDSNGIDTGKYSCPLCSEERLTKQVEEQAKEIEQLREALEQIRIHAIKYGKATIHLMIDGLINQIQGGETK